MTRYKDDEGRIDTEERGSLFLIAIDRPAKLNGFTPTMMAELAQAYSALEAGDYRCGILYAVGKNFTAGLDLPKMAPVIRAGEAIVPATGAEQDNRFDPTKHGCIERLVGTVSKCVSIPFG